MGHLTPISKDDDARWMGAAISLSQRGRGRTAPNPCVGAMVVRDGSVIGRGWTRPHGRPHAEAVALEQAGDAARGATLYTSLEPCAHVSPRGPTCTASIIEAGIARVVIGLRDPDPRTDGQGIAMLEAAGIAVSTGIGANEARRAMQGFLSRQHLGRAHVTLKLATSLDGRIARSDGESRWITGEAARAHGHVERARHDAILVGRGTLDADTPRLNVRLQGFEDRAPMRLLLTRGTATAGWTAVASPEVAAAHPGVDHLMVEGGAGAASAFLNADLVDRLLLYRAPILIGEGRAALGDIGLASLADAHGRWRRVDTRMLGSDTLEVYERVRD
ncbi:bifunctional diaminohydroxyphosphoribosylaminopyrimidine deaminase/5-amino-6-(5-phosphoribosylamino)uracil reductase RibD [Sphingomonas sp. AX6]|uniref:bifunctional diaminohydroxyphosphoribosylaminopyrimidine deaminase/5-amino-6-(5-phosphoribosylamino)uracil reductase RibD n=1 Tax=Sphingomonas sp. AX6 TaxID=2653171 RepID=UPI0012F16864|nr:bifunctional diaminohydroxyphosphoribosylaminopyrimidine deaminase/5-amino-6-(5-phosphoribosylamino)uracil reductase RibD [Sphingomonas sp. AX6]VXC55103.1 Diaminohydroxyphosphoribosylaminopyrimidine deaminase,5-amino-6-(5-phosphoribosylamino)uracil reductase [Sphingomonas sp. AX6]